MRPERDSSGGRDGDGGGEGSLSAIPASVGLVGGVRVGVVVSRYHESITGTLLSGARSRFESRRGGVEDGDWSLEVVGAAGAFELATLAGVAARSGRFDAVVVLGCLVKGETHHDEVIAHAVAGELARVSSETGVAVGFGLLTVLDMEQARSRAGGAEGNKGWEAMDAALETVASVRRLRGGEAEAR